MNQKIIELEEELKRREQKPVEVVKIKETYNIGEKLSFEALKFYLGLEGKYIFTQGEWTTRKLMSCSNSHKKITALMLRL